MMTQRFVATLHSSVQVTEDSWRVRSVSQVFEYTATMQEVLDWANSLYNVGLSDITFTPVIPEQLETLK